jgi:aryl-alcohol dehydrogenase-like predicted oxidoreductase
VRHRILGPTGLLVSELCLGAMTFGNEVDADTAEKIIGSYLDLGGNFFDTADCYHAGRSERILGAALATRRDSVVIASKVGLRVGDDANDVGTSAKHVLRSAERSLRHLGTGYLDLYQVHCWDPVTPLDETLGALDLLVRRGDVRYVGVSNFAGWQVTATAYRAGQRGTAAPVSAQQQYSLVERDIEHEVVPACVDSGLSILAWGPLGGGFLSGKYTPSQPPPAGSRLAGSLSWMEEFWGRRAVEANWRILSEVTAVAAETDRTPAQVALAWVAAQPQVAAAIIGASTVEQARDNLGAAGGWLSAEQVARLSAASDPGTLYPQRFQRVALSSRTDYDKDRDAWVWLR